VDFQKWPKEDKMLTILSRLYSTILQRKNADSSTSYVASLFAQGNKKIAQKVGEEATETIIAATAGSKQEIIYESSDLIFHLLILWAKHNISPDDIAEELTRREGISGIEEKSSRN